MFWDVHEINLLMFLKTCILVENHVRELDGLIFGEIETYQREGKKKKLKKKETNLNHIIT